MKRRALIICCDDTSGGKLPGAVRDAINIKNYLTSSGGGQWYDQEIATLRNPTKEKVSACVNSFMKDADYTFTVFSGHGFISLDNKQQHIELSDCHIPIKKLITNSKKQSIIIDACRGYYSPHQERLAEETSAISGIERPERISPRKLFDNAVIKAEEGLTILFSSSKNESSLDTSSGGAYLFSLLSYAQHWVNKNKRLAYLPLDTAHLRAIPLMYSKFDTIQKPTMNREKRNYHFPLAVKTNSSYGGTLSFLT